MEKKLETTMHYVELWVGVVEELTREPLKSELLLKSVSSCSVLGLIQENFSQYSVEEQLDGTGRFLGT